MSEEAVALRAGTGVVRGGWLLVLREGLERGVKWQGSGRSGSDERRRRAECGRIGILVICTDQKWKFSWFFLWRERGSGLVDDERQHGLTR